MLRSDTKCIQKHKKAKNVKPETANYYRSLPLLTYPLSIKGIDGIQNYLKSMDTDVFPMPREEYPFDEFMFQPCPGDVAHFHLKEEGETVKFSVKLFTGDQNPFACSGTVTIAISNSAVEIELLSGHELAKKALRKIGRLPPKNDPNMEETLKEDLYTVVVKLISLIAYAREKDLYPVIVKSNSPVKKKKGINNNKSYSPSKPNVGPRVIYLNALPEIRITDHADDLPLPKDSSGKRPHSRRGFWKTLRSERFKNHPLYMVPNAIRVRPAWIGDKSKIVEGNIYTVLIKD